MIFFQVLEFWLICHRSLNMIWHFLCVRYIEILVSSLIRKKKVVVSLWWQTLKLIFYFIYFLLWLFFFWQISIRAESIDLRTGDKTNQEATWHAYSSLTAELTWNIRRIWNWSLTKESTMLWQEKMSSALRSSHYSLYKSSSTIIEDKQRHAWSVPRWVTAREYQLL